MSDTIVIVDYLIKFVGGWRNRFSYFDKIRLFNFDINDRFIEYKQIDIEVSRMRSKYKINDEKKLH